MCPPRRSVVATVVACWVLVTAAVAPAVAGTTPERRSGTVQADSPATECDPAVGDGYRPPDLDERWTETASAESLNWSAGGPAPVGPLDDCSLRVAAGAVASPTNATVDGARGVVTGVVDLGANGSIALVAVENTTAETDTTTTAGTDGSAATELVLANDGTATATTLQVRAGGERTNVTVPNGRFFSLAVRVTDGEARVAVWDADVPWDGRWDATVSVADRADWRLAVRGPAYVDGLAVGVVDPTDEPTTTPGDDGGPDDGDDEFDFPTEYEDRQEPPNDGGDGDLFLGFVLLVFGGGSAYFARPLTRFSEQIDAIGSKTRASEVEPAEWNVMLTRVVGVVLAVIGGAIVLGHLL